MDGSKPDAAKTGVAERRTTTRKSSPSAQVSPIQGVIPIAETTAKNPHDKAEIPRSFHFPFNLACASFVGPMTVDVPGAFVHLSLRPAG